MPVVSNARVARDQDPTWVRTGLRSGYVHTLFLVSFCLFLVSEPFIRVRSGAVFWAFVALCSLYALVTSRPRLVPALFAFTVIGVAYVLLSYLDVLPDAWTVIYEPSIIPRQSFYVFLLYPLVIASAAMWSYARLSDRTSHFFLAILVSAGVLGPLVQSFAAGGDGIVTSFASMASRGLGNMRMMLLVALSYFLLVKARDTVVMRVIVPIAIGLVMVAVFYFVKMPQLQNTLAAGIVLLCAFIPPQRKVVLSMAIIGVVGYLLLIPFAQQVVDRDRNSGYRVVATRNALSGVYGSYELGVGYGKEVIKRYYPEIFVSRLALVADDVDLASQGVHNSFAQEFMRLGLAGGVCLFWLFFVTCLPPRNGPLPLRRHLTAVYFLLIIAMAFNVALESPVYLVGVAFGIGYVLATRDALRSG